jgi:hypothetical protein
MALAIVYPLRRNGASAGRAEEGVGWVAEEALQAIASADEIGVRRQHRTVLSERGWRDAAASWSREAQSPARRRGRRSG